MTTFRTIYVCGWTFETGGGFDWYWTDDAANAAYLDELKNEVSMAEYQWCAFRFDIRTTAIDPDAITAEIDELFDSITIPIESDDQPETERQGAAPPASGRSNSLDALGLQVDHEGQGQSIYNK